MSVTDKRGKRKTSPGKKISEKSNESVTQFKHWKKQRVESANVTIFDANTSGGVENGILSTETVVLTGSHNSMGNASQQKNNPANNIIYPPPPNLERAAENSINPEVSSMPTLERMESSTPRPLSRASNASTVYRSEGSLCLLDLSIKKTRKVPTFVVPKVPNTPGGRRQSQNKTTVESPCSSDMDSQAFGEVYARLHDLIRVCSDMNDLRTLLIHAQDMYKQVQFLQRETVLKEK